jgi:hypothetical protein
LTEKLIFYEKEKETRELTQEEAIDFWAKKFQKKMFGEESQLKVEIAELKDHIKSYKGTPENLASIVSSWEKAKQKFRDIPTINIELLKYRQFEIERIGDLEEKERHRIELNKIKKWIPVEEKQANVEERVNYIKEKTKLMNEELRLLKSQVEVEKVSLSKKEPVTIEQNDKIKFLRYQNQAAEKVLDKIEMVLKTLEVSDATQLLSNWNSPFVEELVLGRFSSKFDLLVKSETEQELTKELWAMHKAKTYSPDFQEKMNWMKEHFTELDLTKPQNAPNANHEEKAEAPNANHEEKAEAPNANHEENAKAPNANQGEHKPQTHSSNTVDPTDILKATANNAKEGGRSALFYIGWGALATAGLGVLYYFYNEQIQ